MGLGLQLGLQLWSGLQLGLGLERGPTAHLEGVSIHLAVLCIHGEEETMLTQKLQVKPSDLTTVARTLCKGI